MLCVFSLEQDFISTLSKQWHMSRTSHSIDNILERLSTSSSWGRYLCQLPHLDGMDTNESLTGRTCLSPHHSWALAETYHSLVIKIPEYQWTMWSVWIDKRTGEIPTQSVRVDHFQAVQAVTMWIDLSENEALLHALPLLHRMLFVLQHGTEWRLLVLNPREANISIFLSLAEYPICPPSRSPILTRCASCQHILFLTVEFDA